MLRLFIAAVIGVCLPLAAEAATMTDIDLQADSSVPISEWVPAPGDHFIADTERNIGALVHLDGSLTAFPIATGQKRIVRYIGRTYDATTPIREWTMRSSEVKGDRRTFGKRGVFLRLFLQNGASTPYGVHSHASIEAMLAENDRFKSMGCILVSDAILTVLEQTLTLSGGGVSVTTTTTEHIGKFMAQATKD